MTEKECVNNVGGQHVFPLDALAAVSALSEEFLDPLARFTFVRTLIDIRRSCRKHIDAEMIGIWNAVKQDTDLPKFDIALVTNEENRRVYLTVRDILTKSKADGGSGYCDDCAGRTVTYFCTLPWLKEKAEIEFVNPTSVR